ALDRVRVAEEVGVRRIETQLIQVTRIAEQPKIDFAFFTAREKEPDVRNVIEWFNVVLRLLALCLLTAKEFAAAAIGHPNAGVVIAPSLSTQTRCPAEGYQEPATRG